MKRGRERYIEKGERVNITIERTNLASPTMPMYPKGTGKKRGKKETKEQRPKGKPDDS